MNDWLRRFRGAVGMGLTWGFVWAIPGGIIELLSNLGIDTPITNAVDMWPMVLAIPGFLTGVAFSLVLGIAGRNRRFDQLSVPGFAAMGAISGGAFGLFLVSIGLISTAMPNLLTRTLLVMTPPAVLGALSASGTLLLARFAGREALPSGASDGDAQLKA